MSQLEELGRAGRNCQSLARGSGIVVTESLAQSVALANQYAPEHLCWSISRNSTSDQIQNAGVFLGERSFEVLGTMWPDRAMSCPPGGTTL
ncbi:MAG: histidinol dehydrogenase [Caldilineaceae bacterium]